MMCWECNQRSTYNFGHLCKECKEEWDKYQDEKEAEEQADEEQRTWNGSVYSGECRCGTPNQVVWLIQFNENGLLGMQGTVTGSWCEECIYKMTGTKEIPAIHTGDERLDFSFKNISNIRFIKKLREPNLDKSALDVIEVLKIADF